MKRENRFRPFINALLIDLIYCWQSKATERLRVETAIMITRKHCGYLKDELFHRPFKNDNEEVNFFKNVQPQFTGRLCFYTILYEALVSSPTEVHEIFPFWESEQKRYHRFLDKNSAYIEYLENGNCTDDHKYFLRRTNRQPQQLHSKLYGIDAEYFTALDYMASALFAEKLYFHYVINKTKEVAITNQ